MRVRKGAARTQQRKRLKRLSKGYYNLKHHNRKQMKDQFIRTGQHAYDSRRQKKRDFRSLWIIRINAALEQRGLNYHTFIDALRKADIRLNRKVLAELALNDAPAFDQVIQAAKSAPPKPN
jgi:large subunit ribosomal protein L20